MRVALFQGPSVPGDTLQILDRAAANAAARGARLLVLPELFLTGYNIGAPALQALAEPATGPSALQAANIAARHNIALLYGYPERGTNGALYNSALLLSPTGAPLANYRKTHLFGDTERATFTPGETQFVIAELAGLKLGILICYDVEFPETVRGLALRGADLVAVPTALMQPYDFVPKVMVRTRAFENQIFLIYANRSGTEPPLTYVGDSCIIAPDGTELARAGASETLLVATLDLQAAKTSRDLNTYLQDRRTSHYGEPESYA